jgi:ectoine hydroxylase
MFREVSNDLVTEYRRDGYAFRPDVLSAVEIDVLNAETARLLAGDRPPERFIVEKDATTVRTVANPQLYSDVFGRLVRHPALLAAARALLDDDVYVFQVGVNLKAAFNGDVWFWHQDYPGYFYDDHIPTPRMVNTLIFLDEVTHLNAPMMLVPGSHQHVPPRPVVSEKGTSHAFRYAEDDTIRDQVTLGGIVAPTGAAGSVIFMHVNTLHGSTANLSPWPRRLVTLTYNAISNKATSPSVRPRHIVPDDRDVPALAPLAPDCLTSLAPAVGPR